MNDLDHWPEVHEISSWLIKHGLLRTDPALVVEGYCQRLRAAGLDLWRGYASTLTLHPRIRGFGYSWQPESGLKSEVYIFRPEPSEDYKRSPFRHMFDAGLERLRVRLDDSAPISYPLLERFREQGATDYLAQMVRYGVGGRPDGVTGMAASWTTARGGGFSNREVAMLEHLLPRLALAMETRLSHDIAVNLLNTYVGPQAGRRILDGEIRRGSLESIPAVILYADLRGFTTTADASPHATMVEMLNAYFDCLVPIIEQFDGQVLKFLGDGLLATFPLGGQAPEAVCARALDATEEALRCLHALNGEREQGGLAVMDLDLVLHLGEVLWGNVGSADRLDFTVIGPAVNEASRIEALCVQHDRHILISETFARAAGQSAARLVSIGRFALRGVRAAQSIYTIDGL